MGFARDFKDFFKPTAVWGFSFISLSLLFISTFAFFEHQIYLSSYQKAQQTELNTLQNKTAATLENLKKLDHLTNVRIAASLGDVKRIENILNSVPLLYSRHEFPQIKTITYEKFSNPQGIITRFGIKDLSSKRIPLQKPLQEDSSIVFDQANITSKSHVFNNHKKLEGMLQIQIDLSTFKSFLMDLKTLSFTSNHYAHALLQKAPFPVYAKEPLCFSAFFTQNQSRYGVFFFYMALALCFLVFCASYFFRYFKKMSKNEIGDTIGAFSNLKIKTEEVEKMLLILQQEHKSLQIAFEAYKTLHANVAGRQKEQLSSLAKSLGLLRKVLEEPDHIEILDACLNTIKSLSRGQISQFNTEPIHLKKCLENISSLFADKIYKFNIIIEITCSDDTYFQGDFLHTTSLLITFIGKALYRAPKNGKISIIVDAQNDDLHLEVQDNGYSLKDKEALLKNSFAFFMTEDVFRTTCQENGFACEYSKASNGFNISKMVIPYKHTETVSSNVVQLFK